MTLLVSKPPLIPLTLSLGAFPSFTILFTVKLETHIMIAGPVTVVTGVGRYN